MTKVIAVFVLVSFFLVGCGSVEAATSSKKTSSTKKTTCVIKLGKIAKINIRF